MNLVRRNTPLPASLPPLWRAGYARAGGFSLIELLIVVSIISILAAIAVPNFLEAQTRSKVSRVQADMRTIATALESYRVDNNNYIPRRKPPTVIGGFQVGDLDTLAQDLSRLTTPIAYITSIPEDIFKQSIPRPNNALDYWTPEMVAEVRAVIRPTAGGKNTGWTLFSLGPDGVFGSTTSLGNYPPVSTFTAYFQDYDPTNGTVSPGNVFRFQSQLEAIDVFLSP